MSIHVIPIWLDANGVETGPIYESVSSEAAVSSLIDRGLREARHANGTDIRVLIVDDLTWRRVATIRPKRAQA